MPHIDNDTKFYWYHYVADFRKGFAGLSGLVRAHMHKEVTDGGVYFFINRRRNAIKLLKWEQDGLNNSKRCKLENRSKYWMCLKI